MTARWTIAAQATRMAVLAGVLALAGSGCCTRPKPVPFVAAPVSASVCYYGGSPLGGHVPPEPSTLSMDTAQAVRASIFALQREPDTGLPLLAGQMRLLSAARDGEAIRPTPVVLAGVRYAEGSDATVFGTGLLDGQFGPEARIADLTAALPPGVTAVIQVDGPGPAEGISSTDTPANTALPRRNKERLEIHLHRAGKESSPGQNPYSLALWVRQVEPSMPPQEQEQEEGVLLDLEPGLDRPMVLVFPARASPLGNQTLAVFLHLDPTPVAPDPTFAAAFQGCARAFVASAAVRPVKQEPPQDLVTAFEALEKPTHRRRALQFLARQTHARLTADAALLLDDSLVEALARQVQKDVATGEASRAWKAGGEDHDRTRLGWQIERATAEVLSEALVDRTPPVELEGLLCRFGGEAGRHSGALAALFVDAENEAELHAQLVDVNTIYLDEPSPAARVRAFDWLARRGRAPAGYDPLAPRAARRAALRKAEAAEQAAPAVPSAPEAPPAGTQPDGGSS